MSFGKPKRDSVIYALSEKMSASDFFGPNEGLERLKAPTLAGVPESDPQVKKWVMEKGGECWGYNLYRNGAVAVCRASMPAGDAFTLHQHEVSHEFLFIFKGRVRVNPAEYTDSIKVSGEPGDTFGAGDIVYFKPGQEHRVEVLEATELIGITQPPDENYPG